jgi:acyl-CoA reductase-like NAD-dependent aldehyde dehydrogenase
MVKDLQAYVAGSRVDVPGEVARVEVRNPLDNSVGASLPDCDEAFVDRAVKDAADAYARHRHATPAARIEWLKAMAAMVEANGKPITESIMRCIGKPRRAAAFEIGRVPEFLRACATELSTWRGELLPVDTAPLGAGHIGMAKRIPYGVVGAITPFNAPANLLVQKLAPAIATGNAVVVKPHPAGTEVAVMIAELCSRAGLPPGLFNVVPGDRKAALAIAVHPRISVVTLTGGNAAAQALARVAGAKKFCAELGSNAANIVLADANLADAAQKIARAGFEASGQQCISAQRIFVERGVLDEFLALLVSATSALKIGQPDEEGVDIGPMVSHAAADRVMAMFADAVAKGARVALAPVQEGGLVSPGIVVRAPRNARLLNEEVFGPIVVVQPVESLDDGIMQANDSEFGLQGACFTSSLDAAMKAAERLEGGSIWINEASRFRLDMYPFGGVKQSGFGREGVRYAMEEYSQWKFVGMRASA